MEAKLLDACAVLLGPQARRAGQALLHQLTVAMVRTAFRRLALRTHPDTVGGSPDGVRFIEASRAYELLMTFLLARRPCVRQRDPGPHRGAQRAAGHRSAGPRPDRRKQIYYHGPLPRRRLRLAEFLYYSGYISWQSLISALVWQRSGRPKFGEIARQLRIVSASDMARVLSLRARSEQIGAAASRLRLLSGEDVRRILRIQRARQRPIGRYFVEKERMSAEELSRLLRELFRHNARWRLGKDRGETEEATA
jgi:hypothetical protein